MAGTAQSPVSVVRLQPAAEMRANARHRADLAAVVDYDGVDRARGNENGVSFRELRDRGHWLPLATIRRQGRRPRRHGTSRPLASQNFVERDTNERRCCCRAECPEPDAPCEASVCPGTLVEPLGEPLMNPVQSSLVGQIGTG